MNHIPRVQAKPLWLQMKLPQSTLESFKVAGCSSTPRCFSRLVHLVFGRGMSFSTSAFFFSPALSPSNLFPTFIVFHRSKTPEQFEKVKQTRKRADGNGRKEKTKESKEGKNERQTRNNIFVAKNSRTTIMQIENRKCKVWETKLGQTTKSFFGAVFLDLVFDELRFSSKIPY